MKRESGRNNRFMKGTEKRNERERERKREKKREREGKRERERDFFDNGRRHLSTQTTSGFKYLLRRTATSAVAK